MAREIIQCRFWDRNKKQFIYSGGTPMMLKSFFEYIAVAFVRDEGELSYQTGLLDKNGKEIYEGDIVKSPECDNQQEVKYCDIQESDDMTAPGIGFQFNTNPQDMEIIGNIYENPELIK